MDEEGVKELYFRAASATSNRCACDAGSFERVLPVSVRVERAGLLPSRRSVAVISALFLRLPRVASETERATRTGVQLTVLLISAFLRARIRAAKSKIRSESPMTHRSDRKGTFLQSRSNNIL